MKRVRSFLVTVVVMAAVFALAVWGVIALLERVGWRSTNSCVAVAPDGSSYAFTSEQADNAAFITAVAVERELPARAATIALATALQESKLSNIDYGDRDSLGLFQQRPSQGWGTEEQVQDRAYATNIFYDHLIQVANYENLPITEAAQAVQRSAFPDAYAQHENDAGAWASALTGYSTAALTCDTPVEGPTPTADLMAALQSRTEFGAAPSLSDSGLTHDGAALLSLDPQTLSGISDASKAAWSVGQWLVATSSTTGVSVVVVENLMWVNGASEWVDAGDLSQGAGAVLVG